MLESVAAVKCRGAFVFGLGFKAVAARGDVILDEFKKFRAKPTTSVFLLDVDLLDPDDPAARLLRVGVSKNAVAEYGSVILKDEGIAVRRASKEGIKGADYVFLGNIFKHRGRGIKILRHFGVNGFVFFCDFSDFIFIGFA